MYTCIYVYMYICALLIVAVARVDRAPFVARVPRGLNPLPETPPSDTPKPETPTALSQGAKPAALPPPLGPTHSRHLTRRECAARVGSRV